MKEIMYDDVIRLGFKRQDISDTVFFKHYGYSYFIVSLTVSKSFCFYWDCNTRQAELIRVDKQQNILGKIEIQNLKHLVELLAFFGKIDPKKHIDIIAKCGID